MSNTDFLRMMCNERRKAQGKEELDPLEFYGFLTPKLDQLNMDPSFLARNVNEGFSGGEKKRNEILQLAVMEVGIRGGVVGGGHVLVWAPTMPARRLAARVGFFVPAVFFSKSLDLSEIISTPPPPFPPFFSLGNLIRTVSKLSTPRDESVSACSCVV